MYVKTFEGETLDEALKHVKYELGPDAIILKTVTNKGLKGAFKKSRIEITAAISEQVYEKKARVDHVLNEEQRDRFYQAPASEINNAINSYSSSPANSSHQKTADYTGLGLNRVVNTVKSAGEKVRHSLDDFLNVQEEAKAPMVDSVDTLSQPSFEEFTRTEEPVRSTKPQQVKSEEVESLRGLIRSQENHIKILEQRINEIVNNQKFVESNEHNDSPEGVTQLRMTLKSLDLSDRLVTDLIKKVVFELTKAEQSDSDIVFETALRILNDMIGISMPLFSKMDTADNPVVTVLLSDIACGQTSVCYKIASLRENTRVIRYRNSKQDLGGHEFAQNMLGLNVTTLSTLSEVITTTRKSLKESEHIILDLKLGANDTQETKKFLQTLSKTFKNVEFLSTLSAVQSEVYNRKILSKYKDFSKGIIMTYMDQTLSFGSLINVQYAFNNKPFMFFSNGAVIPEDIEAATSERLIASMFEL
jgi:flagellar biosynthesis protein FlhF